MRNPDIADLYHASEAVRQALDAGLPEILAFVRLHLKDGLILLVTAGAFLIVFIFFCKRLEERVEALRDDQEDVEGRVIGLEVKEYSQDERLDSQESTMQSHAKFIVKMRRDVDELGHDIGWDDNKRNTQVMLPSTTQSLLKDLKKPEE